jgi:WD40 repeat protein
VNDGEGKELMAPDVSPAFSPAPGLPGDDRPASARADGERVPTARRSALVIGAAGYADTQLAWLRPPVSGAADLAAALSDPQVGGFAVDTISNATETESRLAISRFLSGRSADETVVLYLSCHAIRDRVRLYFAAADTWLRYPQRSAVPAAAVMDELDRCGAGNRLLILDCCFIGGFAEDKSELDLAGELGLDGRGIAVLSGSRVREYSYEGRPIGSELPRSVFTEGLAVGLATGAADVDGDGAVTVAEAYNFAYRHVSQNGPRQAPLYHLDDSQGEIVLSLVPGATRQTRPNPRARLTMPGRALTAANAPALPPRAPGALRRPQATPPPGEPGHGAQRPGTPAPGGTGHGAPLPGITPPRGTPPRGFTPPGGVTPPYGAPEYRAPSGAGATAPGSAAPAQAGPPPVSPAAGSPRLVPDLGPNRAGGAHESGLVRLPGTPAAAAAAARSTRGAHEDVVVEQDRDNAYCVAFSPDSRLLASGGWGRLVRIRDVSAGDLVRELRPVGPSVYDLAFSPDGRLLATGGRDGTVALSEVAGGKKLRARKPGGAAVRALAFSPDGELLVSAHEDGIARLWDVPSLGHPRELRTGGETIFGAVFSPDGAVIAVGCADGAIRLWDADNPGTPAVIRAHTGWATGVAFTPDGRHLVSSGADGLVMLHDTTTRERSVTLRAGDGIVNAIALSPDGSVLAGAFETGVVAVWEVASGLHETLPGHAGHTNDVAFSPDGRHLASAGKDGAVHLWR